MIDSLAFLCYSYPILLRSNAGRTMNGQAIMERNQYRLFPFGIKTDSSHPRTISPNLQTGIRLV